MQQSSNQNSNEQRKNMQKLQWLRMSVQLIFVAILIGGLYKFVKPAFVATAAINSLLFTIKSSLIFLFFLWVALPIWYSSGNIWQIRVSFH